MWGIIEVGSDLYLVGLFGIFAIVYTYYMVKAKEEKSIDSLRERFNSSNIFWIGNEDIRKGSKILKGNIIGEGIEEEERVKVYLLENGGLVVEDKNKQYLIKDIPNAVKLEIQNNSEEYSELVFNIRVPNNYWEDRIELKEWLDKYKNIGGKISGDKET